MDIERLCTSPIGQVIPIIGPDPVTRETVEGVAFLPAPLPRELTLSTATWTTINRATAALARLDGAARLIPNPRLLRRPALRREAQSTSGLEGTYAPFVEVLAADEADGEHVSAEIHEILNFERMAELAFSSPTRNPPQPSAEPDQRGPVRPAGSTRKVNGPQRDSRRSRGG